jgi:hypothetical protein
MIWGCERDADSAQIERDLEELRQVLPDPFNIPAKLDVFFDHPTARKIVAQGETAARRLVGFLGASSQPSLSRVAAILLSRFPPATFFEDLMKMLAKANRSMAEALAPGLWLIQLDHRQIAKEIVSLVSHSKNPYPLLLLQRPAAGEVRSELATFIMQHAFPLSLYALYCYEYALRAEDIPLMKDITGWLDIPQMAALSGGFLLKLGSKDGKEGLRAGLASDDEELRKATYREIAAYLPRATIDAVRYDPTAAPPSQREAVDRLLAALG